MTATPYTDAELAALAEEEAEHVEYSGEAYQPYCPDCGDARCRWQATVAARDERIAQYQGLAQGAERAAIERAESAEARVKELELEVARLTAGLESIIALTTYQDEDTKGTMLGPGGTQAHLVLHGSDRPLQRERARAESAESRVRELEAQVASSNDAFARLWEAFPDDSADNAIAASEARELRLREALDSLIRYAEGAITDRAVILSPGDSAQSLLKEIADSRDTLSIPTSTDALREIVERAVFAGEEWAADSSTYWACGENTAVTRAAIVSSVLGEPHTGEDK